MDGISTISNFFSTSSESDEIIVGSPDALEKFYKKLQTMYNLDELKEILDCDDNLLIISSAGSGKTTTLLLKILRDILSGKLLINLNIGGTNVLHTRKILVCTFLRSGAEDLIKKFDEMCQKFNIKGISSANITFKTIHAEVYAALTYMGEKINMVSDENSKIYLREVCKHYGVKSIINRNNSKALTNEEISDIANIVNYARNRLDDSRYEHPLMQEYNLEKVVLQGMIDRFNQLKRLGGFKDFEDLEEELYDAYQKYPNVLSYIKTRYEYIYVDEFQDTSQLQYAILKPYFYSAKGFLCIGDDDQCLVGDTEIITDCGVKRIKNIHSGDKVLTALGQDLNFKSVKNVGVREVTEKGIKIVLSDKKELKGTSGHYIFKRVSDDEYKTIDMSVNLVLFGRNIRGKSGILKHFLSVELPSDLYVEKLEKNLGISFKNVDDSYCFYRETSDTVGIIELTKKFEKVINHLGIPLVVNRYSLFDNKLYSWCKLSDIQIGDFVATIDNGEYSESSVVFKKDEDLGNFVYDIFVPETSNFYANGIISKNCIYGWRGSDVKLIQYNFEKDFNPKIKQLTKNRRCAENILNAVVPSIEKNSGRKDKKLSASNPGGEIDIVVDGGVNYLIKELKEDLMKGYRVGILGRTKNDLLIPAILLLMEGIEDFSLAKSISFHERLPQTIFGLMDLVTKRYTPEFVNHLKLFLMKNEWSQAIKLCDILSASPEYSLFNLPLDDIRYSAPALYPIIRQLREDMKVDPVKAYTTLLVYVEQDVYNGKTIYAQRARDFTYYIRKIIEEHESLKGKSIEELKVLFCDTLPKLMDKKHLAEATRKQNEYGQWVTVPAQVDNSYVRISTVHDAKGKEWDSVYIWNNVNGCFPNTVGKRILTKEELEEERRVHYIAWTRPKKKLVVFTRSDRADGFLRECDLSKARIIEMTEVKNRMRNISGYQNKQEVFRSKDSSNSNIVKSDWKESLKKYIVKYTGYQYICSSTGLLLDDVITKLGGVPQLYSYLEKKGLTEYPLNDFEKYFTDLLESIKNEL